MRFSEFIGQEQLVADLQGALARDRVGHAYLFRGPEGSGRRTLARLFAQALLCEGDGERPCDACRSCLLVKAGTHPDLQIVQADGTTIKIEQMRAIRTQVALKPLLGRHRVFLLAEMERLGEAAANSFLLTLEEPPPGVVFLGWALDSAPLLPTIISRCQVAKLQPLPVPVLARALVARGIDAGRAEKLAAEAGGLPGLALRLLDEETGQSGEDDELLRDLLAADLTGLLRKMENLAKTEREEIGRRLAGLEQVLGNAIKAGVRGGSAADSRVGVPGARGSLAPAHAVGPGPGILAGQRQCQVALGGTGARFLRGTRGVRGTGAGDGRWGWTKREPRSTNPRSVPEG